MWLIVLEMIVITSVYHYWSKETLSELPTFPAVIQVRISSCAHNCTTINTKRNSKVCTSVMAFSEWHICHYRLLGIRQTMVK